MPTAAIALCLTPHDKDTLDIVSSLQLDTGSTTIYVGGYLKAISTKDEYINELVRIGNEIYNKYEDTHK